MDKRIYYQQLCSNRYNKLRKNEFVRNRLRLGSIDYYFPIFFVFNYTAGCYLYLIIRFLTSGDACCLMYISLSLKVSAKKRSKNGSLLYLLIKLVNVVI